MATVFGLDIAGLAAAAMDWVYFGLIVLGFILLGVGILVAAFVASQYKTRVRIRHLIKGRTFIYDTKARKVKAADGNYYLRLWKIRENMQMPPEEAVDIDRKGRPVLEVYRTQTGEYIYITDKPKVRVIPKEILRIKDPQKKEEKMQAWQKEHQVEYAFHPFTSQQRATTIAQTIKAQQRKTEGWKRQLPTIVAIGALVILVVSLFIFWGDIAKPVIDMQGQINANEQIRLQQLEVLRDIQNDVQTLKNEVSNDGEEAPN